MQNKKIDPESVAFQVIAPLTCGAAGWQRPAATTWWLTTSFLPRSSNSRRQKVGHRYSNQILATSLPIFVASLWGKVCFRCAVGARIWAGEYFSAKEIWSFKSIYSDQWWSNGFHMTSLKYLSNIPQIISLKWNPQIISLIPNPRSGRGSISSAAFPEHHRVSTWALQQFYSSIKVWKWEKDKKGVTQPLVIKFYI